MNKPIEADGRHNLRGHDRAIHDDGHVPVRRGPSSSRLLLACVVVIGLLSDTALAQQPPRGYQFSYAVPDCAPWDGAAVSIYMGPSRTFSTGAIPPATPYVSVAVWQGSKSLAGATVDLSALSKLGAAASCRSDTDCEKASAGTIRFGPARPDGALEGTIDLTFPTRGHIAGGFHATWYQRRVLCG